MLVYEKRNKNYKIIIIRKHSNAVLFLVLTLFRAAFELQSIACILTNYYYLYVIFVLFVECAIQFNCVNIAFFLFIRILVGSRCIECAVRAHYVLLFFCRNLFDIQSMQFKTWYLHQRLKVAKQILRARRKKTKRNIINGTHQANKQELFSVSSSLQKSGESEKKAKNAQKWNITIHNVFRFGLRLSRQQHSKGNCRWNVNLWHIRQKDDKPKRQQRDRANQTKSN